MDVLIRYLFGAKMSQMEEETFVCILPLRTSPQIFLLLMSKSKTLFVAAFLACLTARTFAGTVLIADNFNAPDTNNFDNSDQTGRRSGLLASDIQLRSALFQHGIAGNQLNFGVGRVRFQSAAALPTNVWWNFASGVGGTQILADHGLLVQFDWTPPDNTSNNWVSFDVGFLDQTAGEPSIRVNDAQTDFGILFRDNGGTQYFDNGAATDGPNFDASTVAPRHVALTYSFSSFADGTDVLVSASVNGVPVLSNQQFQWDNNSGALFMELGNLAAGAKIDNFSIATIPEPSGYALLGFMASLGLALHRRR